MNSGNCSLSESSTLVEEYETCGTPNSVEMRAALMDGPEDAAPTYACTPVSSNARSAR